MRPFAFSPLGRLAGHWALRGVPRLLFRSYAKATTSPPPTITTSRHGDRFHVDFGSFLEWQAWAFGAYEPNVAQLFERLVRPGATAIDVGANVGIHTIRLARLVGPTGLVVAVEAAKDLASRLQANVALNGLANVIVVEAAAAEKPRGLLTLHRPATGSRNEGRSSLLEKPSLTGAAEEVRATSVDELAGQLGAVRLLKIDVEGTEDAVLRGAKQTLESHRPVIVCEINPDQAEAVVTYLRELSYDLQQIGSIPGSLRRPHRLALRPLPPGSRGAVNLLACPVAERADRQRQHGEPLP